MLSSFAITLLTAFFWLLVFFVVGALAFLVLCFLLGCWAERRAPDEFADEYDDSLATTNYNPTTGQRVREFAEPEADTEILDPSPEAYSDLPAAWVNPDSGSALDALGAQGSAWLPPRPINGSRVFADAKPPGQPCAD